MVLPVGKCTDAGLIGFLLVACRMTLLIILITIGALPVGVDGRVGCLNNRMRKALSLVKNLSAVNGLNVESSRLLCSVPSKFGISDNSCRPVLVLLRCRMS